MSRRKNNRRHSNFGSWADFFLFVMTILCIFLILSLFDSSLAGESGRNLGKSLRSSFGGAVIVLLLFGMYLCIALFMRFRVPLLPRQILGTLQLYISFAFMLGLLRETGFNSEATLFIPGAFGHGLAKFFVLNIGTFITLILVIGSFILSAYLYGSKILRVSLPSLPSLRNINLKFLRRRKRVKPVHTRRRRDLNYEDYTPEQILFGRSINVEGFNDKEPDVSVADFNFGTVDIPKFRNASNDSEPEQMQEPEEKREPQNPVEVFDNILAILNTASPSPENKKTHRSIQPRKIRRPLHTVMSGESESSRKNKDSVFPPPIEIFGPAPKLEMNNDRLSLSDEQGNVIISTLKDFKINASIAKTVEAASVIQYQIELAPGTKVSKVSELDGELAMALSFMSVRIEAPIPGTRYTGIEVPRRDRKIITLRSIIESEEFRKSTSRLPIALGMNIDGKVSVHGLDDMPHMMITGSKGSGRSMFVNTCILSMCSVRSPDELKLILIDPRHLELSVYEDMPHLLASPASDSEDVLSALQWAMKEMETRTENFSVTRTRNLASYNRRLQKDKRLPEIVIVINEFDDLLYLAGNVIDDLIVRLAQKGGICGIHVIISAEKNVPELIKSNIPVCAAFTESSKEDSKSILGVDDAFKLTGKGDMLFRRSGGTRLTRIQAPFITEERISDFVDYMIDNFGVPKLIDFD